MSSILPLDLQVKEDVQVAQPEPEAVASVSQSKPGSIASTATAPPPPPPPPPAAAPQPQKRADGRIVATPYAKKLAKELGVDLSALIGSGPAGRITAQDVEGYKSNGGELSMQGQESNRHQSCAAESQALMHRINQPPTKSAHDE